MVTETREPRNQRLEQTLPRAPRLLRQLSRRETERLRSDLRHPHECLIIESRLFAR